MPIEASEPIEPINESVNAVIFISAFLNTWEFWPLLVNHFQNLPSLTFVIIISPLVTLSLLMISPSFELLLRESLLISKLKPLLNANLSSVPLTKVNKDMVWKLD